MTVSEKESLNSTPLEKAMVKDATILMIKSWKCTHIKELEGKALDSEEV